MNKTGFCTYHPFVNFGFFALVLVFSMLLMHPAALLISLLSALAWSACLNGKKTLRLSLTYMLPTLLATAIINPAFNHRGVTVLAYLPTGNPLTLESLVYGVAAGLMLVSVLFWFTCYNKIITADKTIFLFGRVAPALSLVLSMIFRFVPRFNQQLRSVNNAQKALGRDTAHGGIIERAKQGGHILSIMVTWALENGVDTADSMVSRGYGLPGRGAFHLYKIQRRDILVLAWLGVLAAAVGILVAVGALGFNYFPKISATSKGIAPVIGLVLYFLLCNTPIIIDKLEGERWRRSR